MAVFQCIFTCHMLNTCIMYMYLIMWYTCMYKQTKILFHIYLVEVLSMMKVPCLNFDCRFSPSLCGMSHTLGETVHSKHEIVLFYSHLQGNTLKKAMVILTQSYEEKNILYNNSTWISSKKCKGSVDRPICYSKGESFIPLSMA